MEKASVLEPGASNFGLPTTARTCLNTVDSQGTPPQDSDCIGLGWGLVIPTLNKHLG